MSSYLGLYGTSTIDADEVTATDITCENLIVTESIQLPDFVIPDDWIISVSGNKIIDPLYINNIYEKTTGSGISLHNKIKLYDISNTYKVTIQSYQSSDYNLDIPNITQDDEILVANYYQTIFNKDLVAPNMRFVDSFDFTKKMRFDCSGIFSAALRTLIVPDASGTIILDTAIQTLINKTISGLSNTLTNIQASSLPSNVVYTTGAQILVSKSLVDGGTYFLNANDNTIKLQFSVGLGVSNSNLTLVAPPTTGTGNFTDDIICRVATQNNIANKTFLDSSTYFQYQNNTGGKFKFDVSGITSLATRTLVIQDSSDTLVGRSTTDTLSHKTVDSTCTINDAALSSNVVLKTATQILTNKTIASPIITGTVQSDIKIQAGSNLFVDDIEVSSNSFINILSPANINDTTDSSNYDDGSFTVQGGVGIAKTLRVGQDIWGNNLHMAGNVSGNSTLTAFYYAKTNYSTTQSMTYNQYDVMKIDNVVDNPSSTTIDTTHYTVKLPIAGIWRISASTYFFMSPGTGTYESLNISTCTGNPNIGSDIVLIERQWRWAYQFYDEANYIGRFSANDKVYAVAMIQGTSPTIGMVSGIPNYKSVLTCEFIGL